MLAQIGAFALPALLPGYIARWDLSKTEAGWLVGIFFAAYVVMVPVLVSLTDRVRAVFWARSPRRDQGSIVPVWHQRRRLRAAPLCRQRRLDGKLCRGSNRLLCTLRSVRGRGVRR